MTDIICKIVKKINPNMSIILNASEAKIVDEINTNTPAK